MKKRATDDVIFPATLCAAVILLALYLVWHFALRERLGLRSCWFFSHWQLYCPGCGGTRALTALLGGHPLRSLYYHPALLFTLVSVGGYLASQSLWRLRGRRGFVLHYRDKWLYLLGVLLLLHCLVRNFLHLALGLAL